MSFIRTFQKGVINVIRKQAVATTPKLALPDSLLKSISEKGAVSKDLVRELKGLSKTAISNVTVQTALGGMRGAQVLICETSMVDPNIGLIYRGEPVHSLIPKMPVFNHPSEKSKTSKSQPTTEGLLWLLLTGNIPTNEQTEELRHVISKRMKLPEHVISAVHGLPITAHPMTQFITGIAACQTESTFTQMYSTGTVLKREHWKYALDDGLTLLAKLPALSSLIYRRISNNAELSVVVPTPNMTMDWSGNISSMMGFTAPEMADVIRLYMFLHADHEGGNVSAHAAHLVGSALADPYLSFAASMAGLAGPLHGLANQQCLIFFRQMQQHLQSHNKTLNKENVKEYIETEILGKNQVVPGFGHAVLRVTDPRFTLQHEFAKSVMSDTELFTVLKICLEVVPPCLNATGKVNNPYPNIDAHSGIILDHFGIKEEKFFTVLFGVSRAVGIVSQLVWDRLLNLPIERPKSVTLQTLKELAFKAQNKN